MKQQQHQYGSINEDTLVDEETALVPRGNEEPSLSARSSSSTRKYGLRSLLVTLAVVAAFAFLAFSGESPSQASAKSSGADGGSAPMFDWKAYGANIKTFWADKKADWSKQKADLEAKNATTAESKEAKSSYWNSTMPDFADVLNTTKAAKRQQKKAEMEANEAAVAEAMAEVKAQRGQN